MNDSQRTLTPTRVSEIIRLGAAVFDKVGDDIGDPTVWFSGSVAIYLNLLAIGSAPKITRDQARQSEAMRKNAIETLSSHLRRNPAPDIVADLKRVLGRIPVYLAPVIQADVAELLGESGRPAKASAAGAQKVPARKRRKE